jgi:site-specific recombinase XerD
MEITTLKIKHTKAPMKMETFWRQYERSLIAEGKSPDTRRGYRETWDSYRSFLEISNLPDDISSMSIAGARDYFIYLRNRCKYQDHPTVPSSDKPISVETIRFRGRSIKAAASWAFFEGITNENRLQNLKLPKAQLKLIEPLTNQEVQKLFKTIDRKSPNGQRDNCILSIALDTGLRISEIASITLSHLNLEGGFIKVLGKGAKERVVPIGKHASLISLNYIEKVREAPPEFNYLFVTNYGKPITVNTLKMMFRRLGNRSGVTRLHAHLCRHTFAINYLLNGGDIFSLKAILGHSSLAMVSRYLHFTSSQITERHHQFSPMDRFHNKV